MKDKNKINQCIYTFSKPQIQRGDVRDFLAKHDPFRLSNNRVESLLGRVVICFEGISVSEVPIHPQLRPLLRRLHAIWPWSGFFLDLTEPLGPACGINKLPLQALGLCLTDVKLALWQKSEHAHFAIGPQLQHFFNDCHEVIDHLGRRTSLSSDTLHARHDAVSWQFNGIFNLGGSAELSWA